jgi:hypothetical protein
MEAGELAHNDVLILTNKHWAIKLCRYLFQNLKKA